MFTRTKEKCSLVGKDDSATGLSLLTTAFPSISFWSVTEPNTLVPWKLSLPAFVWKEFAKWLEEDVGNCWGGSITAGEIRGVRPAMWLLSASSVQAEFSVFCWFLNSVIRMKFYVTNLCRNKSHMFITYEESYVFVLAVKS